MPSIQLGQLALPLYWRVYGNYAVADVTATLPTLDSTVTMMFYNCKPRDRIAEYRLCFHTITV